VPLGILGSYLPQEQVFQTGEQTYLYLFTDGIIEAQGEGGDEFGTERIKACLSFKEPGFNKVLDAFHQFTQGQDQKDDLTLVELHCNSLNPVWGITETARASIDVVPLAWKTSLEFEPSALRKLNPVPIVMNSLMEIQGLKAHREALYVIVSELFSNALEHGLLALDSSLKQTPDGSMQFYELREQQLQQLSEGKITITLSHLPVSQGGRLTIEVQDTGKGFEFDPEDLNDKRINNNYGRGMMLLKKLCQCFEYIGSGNQVKATYEWTMLNTQHES
jgi:anti-sigma regulatory factor (Ser/Thr protein kinase)